MTLYKVIHDGGVYDEDVSLDLAKLSAVEALMILKDGLFKEPALIVNQETDETEFEVYVTLEFRRPKTDGND